MYFLSFKGSILLSSIVTSSLPNHSLAFKKEENNINKLSIKLTETSLKTRVGLAK